MIYFDTSALVPLVVPEPASGAMHAWLAARLTEAHAISDWTITEFASALGMRARLGTLQPPQLDAAWAQFRRQVVDRCLVLTPSAEQFAAAADLALRFDLGLRAGDALHVAIARGAGVSTLVTLDHAMAAAASRLGLPVASPA
ncbi:MAG: type II toxin-antitoxin system VapC family toxin [Geminicoccaceae bacterium]